MRILHVSPVYYPAIGGHAIHMQKLSETMASLNEEVTVFTSRVTTETELRNKNYHAEILPVRQKLNGVEIIRFKVNYPLYDVMFTKTDKIRGGYRLKKIFFNEAVETLRLGPLTWLMVASVIKYKPDIVLSLSGYYANTYFCYLAKKIIKFPLVIIPSLHMPRNKSEELPAPMLAKYLQETELVIAMTQYEKECLIEKGCDPKKISVIGVGINPDNFKHANGKKFRKKLGLHDELSILFLGRRSKGKGIETLIRAMPMIWQEVPSARLIIAGVVTEEFRDFENKIILELSVEERNKIIFVDTFTQDEKADIFDACDVFAMPASGESFGIVYLESWICKKPVIAVKNSAPASFIDDGKDGLLVEYGDTQEVASAIVKLLKDKDLRLMLGERGRKKVLQEFTWDIIARKMRNEYSRLIEN